MANDIKRPNLDSVTTINEDGSRYVIHPADVKGKFTYMRRMVAAILIAVYVALPWITINGFPAVFLNIKERHFHLFGITLLANDLWILFFLISGLAFALFILSSVVGRVWCGWYCPYTVFLDHVYRRAERWIEGDSLKRRKLDKSPWNKEKIIKRGFKWCAYILISLVLAHIFLAYFISLPDLWAHMNDNPTEHLGEFAFIIIFTAIFAFTFGSFREQFCIIMCPYGRFQSALTDDDTITVAYDYKRGEPRGKKRKKEFTVGLEPEPEPIGDCVDCRRCVNVCPTGIDIRNGIQLECVACSACVDACDDIMTKLKRPKGLIRYDSVNNIETGKRKIMRPRLYLYAIFLLLGASAMALTLVKKARPFHSEIHRFDGQAAYISNDEGVRNIFTVSLTNKRHITESYTIKGKGSSEIQFSEVKAIKVDSLETKEINLNVYTPKKDYDGSKDIEFIVNSAGGSEMILKAKFTGPNKFLYKRERKKK